MWFLVHYNLKNHKINKKKLIQASKEIQHRGPDDMSTFFNKKYKYDILPFKYY